MPYTSSSTYESRGESSYQTGSSFIDAESRHPAPRFTAELEVTNAVTPSQGTAGSTVLLHIRTNYDLAEKPQQSIFAFMFNTKRCEASLEEVERSDDSYTYCLRVEVPSFPSTNSWNPTMMLKLRREDKHSQVLRETEAGMFTYTDMSPTLAYSGPEKKRKYSNELGETEEYPENAKRANTQRLQAKPRTMSVSYSGSSSSPQTAARPLHSAYGYESTGYDLSKQPNYTSQLSQKSLYAVPGGISLAQTEMKPPQMSPSYPSYGQYGPVSSRRGRGSIAGASSRPTVLPSPSAIANPVLVRAPPQSAQAAVGTAGQPFNPYLMYPSKAQLKIEGDLTTMSEGWTREEVEAQRRLVQFERSQSGSTIVAKFAPVTLEARPPRSICVSCILWEEKGECFITSVDTIMLLEQLVNVRFTVEEKNRIRRNLEGFKPVTVSKAKADSEEFFKVIMGFPAPKPRNIEKDVKVFPWKILAHALKKIIGKYVSLSRPTAVSPLPILTVTQTASYSSTAGAGSLPSAHSSVHSGAYLPYGISHQATSSANRNTSPRSVTSTIASGAYTPSMTSSTMSPNLRSSAGQERSAGHGMSVSQGDPTGQGMSRWTTAHQQVSPYVTGLPAAGSGAWGYGAYLDTSSASAPGVPSAAQTMQMQRSDVTPDISQMSTNDPYQQYSQSTTRV